MATLRRVHQLTHIGTDKFGAGVKGVPILLASEGSTVDVNIFTANSPAITIVDCWGVMVGAGAAADTFALTDGTNTIVTAVDVSAAGDTDIVRALEINDAFRALAAGSSLVVTRASAAAVDVYVLAYFT